jgi:hypothetical protein
MALVDSRTGDLELSLKLYHRRGLQLGYQQSITEARVNICLAQVIRRDIQACAL